MVDLTALPETNSGHIRKRNALEWLVRLPEPATEPLLDSVVPQPADFSGSKYPTPISTVRLTGDAAFIAAAARQFRSFNAFENERTRLQITLQRATDRETGRLTDNYALYLSVAERG